MSEDGRKEICIFIRGWGEEKKDLLFMMIICKETKKQTEKRILTKRKKELNQPNIMTK